MKLVCPSCQLDFPSEQDPGSSTVSCPYCGIVFSPDPKGDSDTVELSGAAPMAGSDDDLLAINVDWDKLVGDLDKGAASIEDAATVEETDRPLDDEEIDWLSGPMESAPGEAAEAASESSVIPGHHASRRDGPKSDGGMAASSEPSGGSSIKLDEQFEAETEPLQEVVERDRRTPAAIPASAAVQPYEMATRNGGSTTPSRRGVVGLLLTAAKGVLGLIAGLIVLQLVLWWALRSDPLYLAVVLPDALSWLAPHEMTMAGKLAAAGGLRGGPGPSPATTPSAAGPTHRTAPPTSGEPSEGELGESSASPLATEGHEDAPPPTAEMVPPAEARATEAPATPPTETSPERTVTPPVEGSEPSPAVPPDADASASSQPAEPSTEPATPPGAVDPAVTPEPPAPAETTGPEGSGDGESVDEGLEANTDSPVAESPDPGLAVPIEPAPMAETAETGELRPVDAPVFGPQDIARALTAAREATERLNETRQSQVPTEQLKDAAREFYRSFCDLAEAATLVHRDTAQAELAETRALITALTSDHGKLRMIGTSSVGWMSRQLGDGVMTTGTIQSIHEVGDFTELALRPTGRDDTILVVAASTMAEALAVGEGDSLILLGYIVRDPARQLPQYATSATEVVWITDVAVESS